MLRQLKQVFKLTVCLSLAILVSFNFLQPAFALSLQSPHLGFIQYVAPIIELLEGAEAAAAVTRAVTVGAEALTAAEVGTAGTAVAGEAVAASETMAFVDGGLSAVGWLRLEINPTTIRAMSRTLGTLVNRGYNVMVKHGDRILVTGYMLERGTKDIYKAYNQYKAERQKLGNPLDPCKPQYVRPESSSEGYYFYDFDACPSEQ